MITGIVAATVSASLAVPAAAEEKEVLRVGMECAYAPFNWTQDTDTTPDGSTAVQIYGSDYDCIIVNSSCFSH